MASRPSAVQPLGPEDKLLIKSWLAAFAQSWTPIRLAERVAELPPVGDRLRLPALIELAKIDLRRRWEQGERREVECYLSDYPELGTPETAALGIVRAEFESRQKAGTPDPLGEVSARFPRQAAQLQRGGPATMMGGPAASETIAPDARSQTPPLPPSPSASAPPEYIGRYKIIRQIGQGGMARVYLARDDQLSRDVALKVPRFDPDEGKIVRERFLREAKAAAALQHPNVCAIYEIGEDNGVPFFAMAHVEGRPLSDYIDRKGGIASVQAALLIRKVALALKEAHRQGIVHRDLKPANIMIDQRKEPVVMDFGLARLERQEASRLTKLGAVLGTPQYMPPEQVAGNLDLMGPACDIYSLGVILYELLTGRTPFSGVPTLVLAQVLTQDSPPANTIRPELDGEIVGICMKAIARKPENRYASMEEFASALNGYIKKVSRGQPLPPALQIPVAVAAPEADTAPVAKVVPTALIAPEPPPLSLPAPARINPRNWHLLLGIGLAGVGGMLLIVALVWLVTRKPAELPGVGGTEARVRLEPLQGAVLNPDGSTELIVTIVRENCTGPVALEFEGLPEDIVSARSAILQPEKTVYALKLFARASANLGEYNLRVIAALGEQRAEAWTVVAIRPPDAIRVPVSPPQPGAGSLTIVTQRQMTVMQGRGRGWDVEVRRNNYKGSVTVSLEGLPRTLACVPVRISENEATARLVVIAATEAPLESFDLQIVAVGGSLRAEELVKLTVKELQYIEVLPLEGVKLQQEDRVEVEVVIKRHRFSGDVEVWIEGLPELVTGGRPQMMPADSDRAKFVLRAEKIAAPGMANAKVLARSGEAFGRGSLSVTVEQRP